MKKIVHVPFTYMPSQCGGTEVYVRSLARALPAAEWSNVIAAPGDHDDSYPMDAVRVHRLAITPHPPLEVLYGEGDARAAESFARVLDAEQPDLVHFHAFSPAVSVRCLEAARQRGLPCVYTYHTPTLACSRGTLMRWGRTPCDGEMRLLRCAACTLHGLGVPAWAAWPLVLASPMTGAVLSRAPFRIQGLTAGWMEAVRRWLAGMTQIVALCDWGRDVLGRNGVEDDRLQVVRHGLTQTSRKGFMGHRGEASEEDEEKLLRVGFLGRLDATKGLQVLVAALRQVPDLRVELHCHLLTVESVHGPLRALLDTMEGDERIQVHAPVSPDSVLHTMSSYDVIAVPSVWLETGPLVVLEAFAAGVPVLGSDLGGIAEWVRHEHNGLLAPAGDAAAWAGALTRLVRETGLREWLAANVQPPPSMSRVAEEMGAVYQRALEKQQGGGGHLIQPS